ncbi:FUSC family protein [Acidocella sp.]|uniref:FUSC family protein n=1 Tax=Acidocella sp. TaxID=50710 RepID=UPI003D046168
MKPVLPNWALNLRALSLSEGLRAFCAVALPLLIGELFDLPRLGLAAFGALLTCYADPGGPAARRAPAVIAFALAGGVLYGLFTWLGAQGALISAPIAGVLIFCASFARIYGQSGLQVGNLISVAVVLALGAPEPSAMLAVVHGVNFLAGAAWAVLLTVVIWQTHPYAVSRRALADAARRLAKLNDELVMFARDAEGGEAFSAHALEYRGQVREAIETARGVAYETFRRRGLISPRGAQISLRLESLDRIFGAQIALSEQLEQDPSVREECVKPLRLISGWLAAMAPEIEADRPLDTPRKRASLKRLRQTLRVLPDAPERHVLAAIAEQFAVLIAVAPTAKVPAPSPGPADFRRRLLSPVRQNFTRSSAAFRHALRVAIIATPVLAVTSRFGGLYAHWATITLVFCLQPYFAATWARTAERSAGTVLGGVLAAVIGLFVHTDLQLAIAMLPLSLCAFALRTVNFSLYIAVLTPMIVLLIEQIRPSGESELYVALSRVLWSLLGGALAVLGSALLWPSFEAPKLEATIAAAKRAHAAYAEAVIMALLGQGEWRTAEAARRMAGLASNNLEAALSRALAEPHAGYEPALVKTAAVDAALRRMAGRLSLLAVERPPIAPQEVAVWQGWPGWIRAALETGEAKPRPPVPVGPGAEDLARLALQVRLMTG